MCFRHALQAPGCTGAREAALLQSQEELDSFLGPQRQGSQPARAVWTSVPTEASAFSPSPAPLSVQPPLCAPSVLPGAGSVCAWTLSRLRLTEAVSAVCVALCPPPRVRAPCPPLLVSCPCLSLYDSLSPTSLSLSSALMWAPLLLS